jgi:hypothetical protein
LETTKTVTITKSQTFTYTLPDRISGIENLPEVKDALRSEKEQLISFSDELRQFQLDMNELDDMLAQLELDGMAELSDEMSLKLQIIMDRRSKLLQTLSSLVKTTSSTQETIIQNIK